MQDALSRQRRPVSYDRLLIATGAKSFIPPVGDFRNASNVFGLRDLRDAQEIDNCARGAKEILIVGSGLVEWTQPMHF